MINRLTSLELQGYKTFATLTRLEFPGQVTAIVGPNGSGKSNIADSIRWVLGEQSYSLLRAKRTEDMIFSGSQQRSRAGMASATITFNNEDGWLPIDYSEVSISRRAYRDGQNEYLLNGQKVRLKDISELLSQTGLSERTYTIIGQGLVDVALALKPDERRKLFEEAAGIGLYRTRKEESLRRLESTRKNLDRILDIMTEIRPRLRSLRKQAERWGEYERVRADLQVLLRDWYGFHWHQRQQDLRNVRSAYQDQEKRLSTLREKYAESELKVEDARKALQGTRQTLETAHSELSEYHHKLEQITRELAIIDERQRSNMQQRGHLEIDIANLQEEINDLVSQENNYKAEVDQRLAEYESAAQEVEQVETNLVSITSTRDATQTELDALRKSHLELETKKVQTTAKVDELKNRVVSLQNEKQKVEISIQNLDAERSEIVKNFAAYESNFQKEQHAFETLQSDLETDAERLNTAQTEKQTVDQKLSSLETAQAKLRAQLDVLKQAEAALSGYSEGSKSLVERSRKGRLPAGIEPLAKHLIIEEQYEKAISAALGELTDLLVVPSKDKDLVIEYLESAENERVALVSTDQVHVSNHSKSIKQSDGVFGFANELIEVDGKYRELVDQLFSDTIIVRDRNVAQRLQPDLTGTEKAVTLNGLVFQANGVMISGQNESRKRIGRTRQQGEMTQELEKLSKQISELAAQREALEEEIVQIKDNHRSMQQKSRELETQRHAAQLKLQQSQDTQTRLTEQLDWHNERLVEIDENISQAQELISQTGNQLMGIDEKIGSLVTQEQEIKAKLEELPLFDLQQSLNHWQTHRIVTQNALESARLRYQDYHKRLEDTRERLKTYQARLTELETSLDEIQQNERTLKEEAAQINQAIELMKTDQISPLTETSEDLESNVTALEKLEDHYHQQVIIAERQFTQLQLELERREDQLNNLRERIEDDFGLVSFDYEQSIDGPTPLPLSDELVSDLPVVQSLSESIESDIKRLKGHLRRIGAVNPEAQQEFIEVNERHQFLTEQIKDLEQASKDLNDVIETLDELMERDFIKTFKAVNLEFKEYFTRLFNGGDAELVFSDQDNPVEGGVDIEARLPGRRQQGLALLSGGERSLTAVALVFALLKVSPTPFCILDEVDAMLDESNVGRFIDLLHDLAKKTQFVIITHNRNTVQAADVIYGVTMGRDSASQMISLKLEEVDESFLEG